MYFFPHILSVSLPDVLNFLEKVRDHFELSHNLPTTHQRFEEACTEGCSIALRAKEFRLESRYSRGSPHEAYSWCVNAKFSLHQTLVLEEVEPPFESNADPAPSSQKGCLVGLVPMSMQSVAGGGIEVKQRTFFRHLLNTISTWSIFLDALKGIEVALQNHEEDPFEDAR